MIKVNAFKVSFTAKVEHMPKIGALDKGINICFNNGDKTLVATFKGKNYRKVSKKFGPGLFAIIQGELGPGNQIVNAGISVSTPKGTPVQKAPQTSQRLKNLVSEVNGNVQQKNEIT